METSQTVDSLESKDDLLEGDEGIWQYWDIQESIAEKEERSWRVEGNRIEHRYRDERSGSQQAQHIYNILWSNIQTLLPALYSRNPKPDFQRRFLDADPVGRVACEHAIPLEELTPVQASLEQAFMELTQDAVEYRTPVTEGAQR